MRGVIRKWGNSAAVRIPAQVLQAAGVRLDAAVDVREENGRIVIEHLSVAPFRLDELVDGITDENRHDLLDEPPRGQEVW